MRIHRVELRNLFQHAHVNERITGNTIGVIGRNGSGKSNFLHSMRFALTGEIPADYTKEEMVRFGADGASYAEVDFTHNGLECTVHRGVAGSETWLSVKGRERVEGIRAVNAALFTITGLNTDVAKYAFVNQKELDSALFDLPSQRERAFQRLCGLSETQTVRDAMQIFLSRRLPEVPDYPVIIAKAQGELPAMEAAAADAKLAFERTPDPGSAEAAQHAAAKAAAMTRFADAITSRDARAKALAEAAQARQSAVETRTSAAAAVAAIDINAIESELRANEATLQRLDASKAAIAELDAAEAALAANAHVPAQIAQQTAQVADARTTLSSVSARMNELRGVYMRDQALLDTLRRRPEHGSLGEKCPTCMQPIQDPAATIAEIESRQALRMQELAPVTAQAKQLADTISQSESWLSQAVKTMQGIEARAVRARATAAGIDRSALGDAASVAAAVEARRIQKNQWQQYRNADIQAASSLHWADLQHKNADAALQAAEAEVRAAADNLREQTGSDNVPSSVQELRDAAAATMSASQNIRKAASAYEQLRANADITAAARDRLVAQIAQLQREHQESENLVRVRDLMTRTADWFHYRNGPSALAMHVLRKLNADINGMLNSMNVPFRATASDSSLSYACVFTDDRAQPETGGVAAVKLSGGQKGMLAVAFRLAVFRMFAAKIGILSLDEPTAYLDDTNVSNFCSVLDRLRVIAGDMDVQIFMSTHERQVIGHLDCTVQL